MVTMFSERQERLDWQLIAEVEPLVVEAGAPEALDQLTRLMAGLAHCSLEAEFIQQRGAGQYQGPGQALQTGPAQPPDAAAQQEGDGAVHAQPEGEGDLAQSDHSQT